MRQNRGLITLFAGLGLAACCGAAFGQAANPLLDWRVLRGNPLGQGHNTDPGLNSAPLGLVWVWPRSMDMPAEMVVDDLAGATSTGGSATFTMAPAAANWIEPDADHRASGAWPIRDAVTANIGHYRYADAVKSQVLADIGTTTLAGLPNLGVTANAASIYKEINDELSAQTTYARWTFGTVYPTGTKQGTVEVGGRPLTPNQRYAVYIRFPNSGTTDASGNVRANVDHAMVRVSWGADVNDARTSRIFMVNFGQAGGQWVRLRTSSDDDRFFPYDGTNPIRVTLYTATPDDPAATANNSSMVVPADSVRLVPEALRGDVHAPAVSKRYPARGSTTPATLTRNLTWFGRDETVSPPSLFTLANNVGITGFAQILQNPTAAPDDANNKALADPTSSLRTAAFYCFEDDEANKTYGKLVWRYVTANASPIRNSVVDNSDTSPAFTASPAASWPAQTDNLNGPYGNNYLYSKVVDGAATATATWQAGLPNNKTYSVYVYVPQSGTQNAPNLASKAHYTITTDSAQPVDVYIDQRNTGDNTQATPYSDWRLLASGVHFPAGTLDGTNYPAVGKVALTNDGSTTDAAANLSVAADAVMFVPEGAVSSSVVAAPLLATVRWPSGRYRDVVYFATTDGHVWALDALGVANTNTTYPNSTLTTCYWTYPSIANPDLTVAPGGVIDNPLKDPNYRSVNGNKGPDGDVENNTIVRSMPALGSFLSSPVYVEVPQGNADRQVFNAYIVIGNQNGRLYGLDPAGRYDAATNEPFANTIVNPAAPATTGIPGTTQRLFTWPTTARDKWVATGESSDTFKNYSDDTAVGYISATAVADESRGTNDVNAVNGAGATSKVIVGAGDGHVYAVDVLDVRNRMSNAVNNGVPIWRFPEATSKISPVKLSGALNDTRDRFFFVTGGRVWGISNPPNTQSTGTGTIAVPEWTYPQAAAPGAADQTSTVAELSTGFTAPVWVKSDALDAGAARLFVANQDGTIRKFDATLNGNVAGTPLATSQKYGATRANLTYLAGLQAQSSYNSVTPTRPAVLLPLDTGAITGYDVTTTDIPIAWSLNDGTVGRVPGTALATDGSTQAVVLNTSHTWRGADAITSNNWVYAGDEGDQSIGDMNGQIRGYWNTVITGGVVTGGEPAPNEGQTGGPKGFDIRMADLWYSETKDKPYTGVYEHLGADKNTDTDAVSPYDSWVSGTTDKSIAPDNGPSKAKVVIYEWGDTIRAVAWGAYATPATGSTVVLPTLTFRLTGNGQTMTSVVPATEDKAYSGTALTLYTVDSPTTKQPGTPWVAKATFTLTRGSRAFSQAPGFSYNISVETTDALNGTQTLLVGQQTVTKTEANPDAPKLAGTARNIAIAHPLALTTAAYPTAPGYGQDGAKPYGSGVKNLVGWVANVKDATDTDAAGEVLMNDNRIATIDSAGTMTSSKYKDVAAPVGLVSDGSSNLYLGVDNAANPRPALFVADRTNLYRIGQAVGNLRVDRQDLAWTYNPNSTTGGTVAQKTGNVMNPLPWETFPVNAPNTSRDYPDLPRAQTLVRTSADQRNLGQTAITLNAATVDTNGVKTLHPVQIDLQVSVPRCQPANVNTDYIDVNGTAHTLAGSAGGGNNDPWPNGLVGPMYLPAGTGPTSGAGSAVRSLLAPSGGYVGTLRFFIDTVGNGQYTGSTSGVNPSQTAIVTNAEMVSRQMRVGVAVPPNMKMKTAEETIDLGKFPQSTGYDPAVPFAPYGVGLAAPAQRWDNPDPTMTRTFAPFTLQNYGNVNLINLRVAKLITQPIPAVNATGAAPTVWPQSLGSDSVQSWTSLLLEGSMVTGAPFNIDPSRLRAAAAPTVTGGAGLLGVVSSLDHGAQQNNIPAEASFWPQNAGGSYVASNNAVGWAAGKLPTPTLHKPMPGDAAPQILYVPDAPYGFTSAAYTALSGRARIGVAIPLGTPLGTYSMPVQIFEDGIPAQWRRWLDFYSGNNAAATDDNKIYDTMQLGSAQAIAESGATPPFTLKVTVTEAKLTGAVPNTTFNQVDLPAAGGIANVQPTAMMDKTTGDLVAYWPSNRVAATNGWAPPAQQETPWMLYGSKLQAVTATSGGSTTLDWTYGAGSSNKSPDRWWAKPNWWLNSGSYYPDPAGIDTLFPSTGATGVPGKAVTDSIRLGNPTLIQDEGNLGAWLFWQGMVYKQQGGTYQPDVRTFYTKLANGAPDSNFNGGQPISLPTNQSAPRMNPKPLIFSMRSGGGNLGYLFWNASVGGQNRVYYCGYTSAAGTFFGDPTLWSKDFALPLPGTLSWASNPVPLHRVIGAPDAANQSGVSLYDVVDVVFSSSLVGRNDVETLMSRYVVQPDGTLKLFQMPPVSKELMLRLGNSQTWVSRDACWLFRDPDTGAFKNTNNQPFIRVYVSGQAANTGEPTYDAASGTLTYASSLGGRVVIDPQNGRVVFNGPAPGRDMPVTIDYTPQALRLNVARNDTRTDTAASARVAGTCTDPCAFVDETANPRTANILVSGGSGGSGQSFRLFKSGDAPMPVTRMWLFYRKTDVSPSHPSAVYYSARRLMIRLPAGVLRDYDLKTGVYSIGSHVRINPNGTPAGGWAVQGPVEVDWVRGRLYFTAADEGNIVDVQFDSGRSGSAGSGGVTTANVTAQVTWQDEITTGRTPTEQTTPEVMMPADVSVNEGAVSAFKDRIADRVWVFWASTRGGVSDLYYATLSPQFYVQPGQQ